MSISSPMSHLSVSPTRSLFLNNNNGASRSSSVSRNSIINKSILLNNNKKSILLNTNNAILQKNPQQSFQSPPRSLMRNSRFISNINMLPNNKSFTYLPQNRTIPSDNTIKINSGTIPLPRSSSPPSRVSNKTDGLPNMEMIQRQKLLYLKILEDQLKQAISKMDQQMMIQKENVKVQAKKRLDNYILQTDMTMKKKFMELDLQHEEQVTSLRQQCEHGLLALAAQALHLSLVYNKEQSKNTIRKNQIKEDDQHSKIHKEIEAEINRLMFEDNKTNTEIPKRLHPPMGIAVNLPENDKDSLNQSRRTSETLSSFMAHNPPSLSFSLAGACARQSINLNTENFNSGTISPNPSLNGSHTFRSQLRQPNMYREKRSSFGSIPPISTIRSREGSLTVPVPRGLSGNISLRSRSLSITRPTRS